MLTFRNVEKQITLDAIDSLDLAKGVAIVEDGRVVMGWGSLIVTRFRGPASVGALPPGCRCSEVLRSQETWHRSRLRVLPRHLLCGLRLLCCRRGNSEARSGDFQEKAKSKKRSLKCRRRLKLVSKFGKMFIKIAAIPLVNFSSFSMGVVEAYVSEEIIATIIWFITVITGKWAGKNYWVGKNFHIPPLPLPSQHQRQCRRQWQLAYTKRTSAVNANFYSSTQEISRRLRTRSDSDGVTAIWYNNIESSIIILNQQKGLSTSIRVFTKQHYF